MKIKFIVTIVFALIIMSCQDEDGASNENDKNSGDKSGDLTSVSGFFTDTLTHEGELRTYLTYIPEIYTSSSLPVPLLFNFHGGSGSASSQVYTADFRPIADTANFILVYPQGTFGSTWNSSLPTNPQTKMFVDDFGFVDAMIKRINNDYSYGVDTSRVYATGFSNGADISLALACVRSEKVAAVASVSGLLDRHTAQNSNPSNVAIMSIHGTNDYQRPYEYGLNGYYFTIDELNEYWSNRNNFSDQPQVETYNAGNLAIELIRFGDMIEHYKVISGEHTWLDVSRNGHTTNQKIWNFLSRFDINGLRR
ncbi:MAG: alpha/beta hydrolase family esterase [Candidatus Neomarinimicrobiota bacterium]